MANEIVARGNFGGTEITWTLEAGRNPHFGWDGFHVMLDGQNDGPWREDAATAISDWLRRNHHDARIVMVHPIAIQVLAENLASEAAVESIRAQERRDHDAKALRLATHRAELDSAYASEKLHGIKATRTYTARDGVTPILVTGTLYRSGLLVHRVGSASGGWTVTHDASGQRMGSYDTAADARMAAWRFGHAADWKRPALAIDTAVLAYCAPIARDAYAVLGGEVR